MTSQQKMRSLLAVEQKFRTHLGLYNGTTQTVDDEPELFEDLFHDDFTSPILGNKAEFRNKVRFLRSIATKATVLSMKPLGDSRLEYEVRFTNRAMDVTCHCLATVKDGKIAEIKYYDESTPPNPQVKQVFELYDLMEACREYERVHNNPTLTLEDIERATELVFHDGVVANIEGSTYLKADIKKKLPKEFKQKGNIHFEKMEVVDATHVEIILTKENDWYRHQILTVMESKIIRIETIRGPDYLVFHLNEHIRIQNDPDSQLYDMEKSFNNIFHDEFVGNIPEVGSVMKKDDAKKLVFTDFVQRAKLSFEKIEVLDPTHVEIIITKENEWRRHQILTVKDGKIAKLVTVKDSEGQPEVSFEAKTSYPVSAQ